MKLIVFCSLLALAYAHHGSCPGGDCLEACRNCGPLENDGEDFDNGTSVFTYGCAKLGDCKEAQCLDKRAVMIVDGHDYPRLICFQGKWHFGYPDFLEETSSAECRVPTNQTCPDSDSSVRYEDSEFKCVCNLPFKDRTDDFLGEDDSDDQKVCSTCQDKKLDLILLVDNSGSTKDVLGYVKNFIGTFIKFFKVTQATTNIALVTSSNSYKIKIDWNNPASYTETSINSAVADIADEDQSYLGSGMEAVKAILIQPKPIDLTRTPKLVVFTDGSVKHLAHHINSISFAANNLEALGVETFVVVTNNNHGEKANAIANGVVDNVFPIIDLTKDNFEIVNRLQKKVCK